MLLFLLLLFLHARSMPTAQQSGARAVCEVPDHQHMLVPALELIISNLPVPQVTALFCLDGGTRGHAVNLM